MSLPPTIPLVWVNLVNSRPCKEIDLEAHRILMEHVEILNKHIDDATDGRSIITDDCLVTYLSNIMGSSLF